MQYTVTNLVLLIASNMIDPIGLLLVLAVSLPSITTHTIYTVTPDDHYYPNTTCHHCHNLQHYLLNVTKYFTSNTQLLFLPGLHHLHTDLIIQNVHNISLIGSTANGTTPDTVIIQCNSSVGITLSNITDFTMERLMIENCKVEKNFHYLIFKKRLSSMTLSHCYNGHLQNITIYSSDYRSTILAVNVLGISSFINVKSNGLRIQYNEMNLDNSCSKLLLEIYQISFISSYNAIILIQLYQDSYKVELEIYNTKFTSLQNSTQTLFHISQHKNTLSNFILFKKCTFEKLNFQGRNTLFFESLSYERYPQITFINCIF